MFLESWLQTICREAARKLGRRAAARRVAEPAARGARGPRAAPCLAETLEPAAAGAPTLSIIICSVNPARFSAVCANLRRLLGDEPHEFIGIHDARSMAEGYNRAIRQARGRFIIACHDDIEILAPDFKDLLLSRLRRFDLLGVAGSTRLAGPQWCSAGPPAIVGQVAHIVGDNLFEIQIYGATPRCVPGIKVLDGLFLAGRREVFQAIGFDEKTFTGFHFYDLDFSFRAAQAGYTLAVCTDFMVIHASPGRFDANWHREAKRFTHRHRTALQPVCSTGWREERIRVRTKFEVGEVLRPAGLPVTRQLQDLPDDVDAVTLIAAIAAREAASRVSQRGSGRGPIRGLARGAKGSQKPAAEGGWRFHAAPHLVEGLEKRVFLSVPAFFQPQQTFSTVSGSVTVVVTDLNADGKPDLVVANQTANNVGVLLGNGNGTFKPQVTYATGGTSQRDLVVADVNGDGKPDIIVVNEGNNNVAVLLGNGNGTFKAQTVFAVGTLPTYVAVGDVNGDGKTDIVAGNYFGHNVSVLLGNGNGTFQAQTTFSTGGTSEPLTVALADLNLDGKLDIIVDSRGTNAISILLGNGNGTFQNQQTFAATGIQFTVADINGDGRPDLIEANSATNNVGVLLGNGNGTFQGQQTFNTGAGSNPNSVAVADVNGDGKADLIVANYGSANVGVLLGNGNGSFAAQQTFASGTQPRAVAAADVNADGRSDIIVTNVGSNSVSVLLGVPQPFVQSITLASGNLGPPDVVSSDSFTVTFSKAVSGVVAADFSLATTGTVTATTPVVVIATGNPAVYTVTVNGIYGVGTLGLNLVNNSSIQDSLGNPLGPAGFQTQQTFATGTGSKPYSTTVADLNGDGKPDLIVANSGGNNVGVLLGNGNGTFQAQKTFSTGAVSKPTSVAVADVNGDGKPDLIVANAGGNNAGVLLGNGNGTFQAQQTFSTGAVSKPYSITAADVNGDGKLDLIVANHKLFNVGVLLGNGNGTFQAQQTFSTGSGSYPFSVAVADVNGDGKPDLIVADEVSYNVGVLLGNGNGTFQAQQTFSTGAGSPVSVAVYDVNGDGKPDLIVANSGGNGNNVGVLLGNGNGTFQSQQTFSTGTGSYPESVAVADVNGDGKPDLIVANRIGNNVGVLLGNGNGSFAAQQTFATGSRPFSVAVADVNGDGKPDLIVADEFGYNVGVLLADATGNFTGPVYTVTIPAADLSIAAAGPGTTAAGADSGVPYTLTVTNNGPDANTGFTVTEMLPTNFTITYTNTTTLASGATVTYSIAPATPLSLATGTVLSDSATVATTATLDPNSGNNTATVTTIVEPEVYFQAQQTFGAGAGSTYSITVSDVNGDGKPDLIVANRDSNNVGVLLGNGNGTFQAEQTFSTGANSSPVSVAVSDVNGDGKPDLIVANRYGYNVGVLLGNGNGTFKAEQTFSTGAVSFPLSVAVADVNGDGKPDLIVANKTGLNVGVLLGNGNGTFQAEQTFSTGANSSPFSVAVADVNGDGKPDLIVANKTGLNVGVLLGNGNGTFQAQQTFSTGGGSFPVSVAVADVNADGKPDLIVANEFGENVGVLLGNGNGTFQAQQTFSTGAGSGPFSVAVADVNGDGKPDLIVADEFSYNLGVLLGNGNGTFQAEQTFSTGAGSSPVSVAVADVNADGKPDLIAANEFGIGVSVLLGDPQPFVQSITATTPAGPTDTAAGVTYTVTFSKAVVGVDASDFALALSGVTATTPVVVLPASGPASVYTVTINGILGVGTLGLNLVNDGSIQDSLNTPLGPVGTFQTQQTFATGAKPYSVAVADVNGDGKDDLVVANYKGDSVGVLLGNGNGTFQPQQTFSTGAGSHPAFVAVADVNGDGKPDLIVANELGNNVGVLLGNGSGSFAAQQTFATGSSPISVAVADVNGDGKDDIVAANLGSNSVSVLLGNGNGTFQGQQTFATGSFPQSVAVADVNDDGKADLVVANFGSFSVSVLLGNGNGTFKAQQTFATGSAPQSVAVADVNGDGKADLVVANRSSNNVSVLLGNGNGTFAAQQTFATGSAPISVAVADVNGDGKDDIVVANYGSNSVSVLLGNGSGSFAAPQTFATGSNPSSVAAADVNGDGKADLVVANYGDNTASVLLADPNGNFTGPVYNVAVGADLAIVASGPGTTAAGADSGLTYTLTVTNNGPYDNTGFTVTDMLPANATFVSGSSTAGAVVTGAVVTGQTITYTITSLASGAMVTYSIVATTPLSLPTGTVLSDSATVATTGTLDPSSGNNTFIVTTIVEPEVYFQAQQTFSTGAGSKPYSVTVADLNGDGKPDLIVAIQNQNTVGVLLGNGNGTFQAQQTFFTGSVPISVAVADVNGDGKPDLIAADEFSNNVGVLLGNGNGTFQTRQTFSTGAGSNPCSVAVADVNGDGKPDLIAANKFGYNVGVLLGNGNGTFQAEQTFSTGAGSRPYSVAVADVNGDGKADLIVANFIGNSAGVLLGNGNGTFQTEQTFSTGAGSKPVSVAVADVNGDGKPDLIAANSYGYNVGVLLGNGNGTFQAQQTFSTGAGSKPYSVTVADLNGDGKPDLIVANRNQNTVGVLLGNGNGTFQAQQTFSTGSVPISVAVADVNGDGKDDLIVANYHSSAVGVLLGDPQPFVRSINATTPAGPTDTAAGVTYTVTFSNAVVGVDASDFALALSGVTATTPVVVSPASGPATVYTVTINGILGVGTLGLNLVNDGSIQDSLNTPLGPVGTFQTQQTFATGKGPYSATVADVNGDGKEDVVVANRYSYNVGVLLGNGNGTFQAQQTFSTGAGSHPAFVAVADANGDGKPDLIVATPNSNTVGVLLGNGNGTFQAEQTFSTGANSFPFSVAVADVNGDGKPDLIVADEGGNNVGELLGNGNGTFQAQQTFSTGANSYPFSVAVADVNGDGKADIVAANQGSNSVSVLLGNGSGSFAARQTFATGSSPQSVAVADVNADGKDDLIVNNDGSNSVSVLLGNGNGTFAAQQTFAVGSFPVFVAVADVNGDGKDDIVVANYGSNNVSVLLGNGSGSFAAQQTFATGSGPSSVAAADVNGDGNADLVVSNDGGKSVSVLLADPSGNFTGPVYNVVVGADLAIVASGPGTTAAGADSGLTYTLTVTNNGPYDNTGFTVTDMLPANMTFVIGSSTAGAVVSGAVVTGQTITYTNSTLASGATVTYSIVATTPLSPATGTTLSDSATVASTATLDPNSANNTSNIVTTIVEPEVYFQAQQTFSTGAGAYSLTVADLNGDGKPDLIVANFGSNTVGVLLGNGNGTFQAQQTFSTGAGSNPISVAVADVNGDGKPDLIVANRSGFNVGVLLGNGNGTFQAQQTFTTGAGSFPFSVAVADVNGDGKSDLIVANFENNTVGVLLGNGNGTFQAQQTFTTGAGSNPISVAVADVNGDGKPDLIVADELGYNAGVLLGNGNGTFQAEQTFSTGAGSYPASVVVADVNGDGKADLLVANRGSNVGVLLGNGNGTFQAQQTFSTGAGPFKVSVAVADVNGDGKPDLIVAVTNHVGVLLGNGNGTFQAQQTFSTGAGSFAVSVAAADVNGDGKPDLIVANGVGDTVGVLLGDPQPVVQSINATTPAGPTDTAASVTYTVTFSKAVVGVDASDFALAPGGSVTTMPPLVVSGSGATYTVTINGISGAGTLRLNLVNNGGIQDSLNTPLGPVGTFQTQQTFAAGAGSSPNSVVSADVNGDGIADLIVANSAGNNVGAMLGNGNGTFQAEHTFTTGASSDPYAVTVADVNGDGKPDIIVANYNSGNVGVLLGNGNGTFQGETFFLVGTGPDSVAVADVNDDGKPDLIVANKGSNNVSVLLGIGSGSFMGQQTYSTGPNSQPSSVAVADVNGDGKLDVVVANYNGGSVGVLLGNGNGTFGGESGFLVGTGPTSVAVADVNDDGKPDLIVANKGSNNVSVLLGTGGGAFQSQQTFSTGAGSAPRAVTVMDVNNDGKPDLVVADSAGNNVGLLLGNGNGTFASPQTFSTGAGSTPVSVAVADVNRDGQLDLIVANKAANNIGVLLADATGNLAGQTCAVDDAISATVSGSTTAVPGNTLQFTIVISNDGGIAATGVAVSDLVPTGLLGATFTATDNGLGATGYTASGSGNIGDTVTLPAGAEITYILNGTVNSSATGTLTDTATAATASGVANTEANVPDSTTANQASATTTLAPSADIYVAMSGSDPLLIGGTDVFTIVVTDNGPSDVTGATLADTFNNLTGVSFTSIALYRVNNINLSASTPTASPASGSLVGTGPTLSETLNMSAHSVLQFVITGTVASGAPATLINTVTVADPAGTSDPTSGNNTTTVSAAVNATGGSVVGRSVFYLHSAWDGNNNTGVATTADFNAIATDKIPLLPGQKATYANVSSFANGIDGIFVDLTGVPNPAAITAADFEFNVGNTNTPGTGTTPGSGWSHLATAPTVTVFAGMGVGGSTRVALTWPAGTVFKEWLQITVKGNTSPNPDTNTGLATPDVFYFGSAPGESGNSTGDLIVNGSDEIAARNDPHSALKLALITDPNDFNRDKLVNGSDEIAARNNSNSVLTALKLITAPGLPNGQGVTAPAASSTAATRLPAASPGRLPGVTAPAASSTAATTSVSSLASTNSNTATIRTVAAAALIAQPPFIQAPPSAPSRSLVAWTIYVDQVVNGQDTLVASTVTDQNGNYDAKALKPRADDVQVAPQPVNRKAREKSRAGYHILLGHGKHLAGYNFSEKSIS